MTLLIFLYIYSAATALSCLFKKRIELTLAPAIFLSILVIYLSGIVSDNLLYGVCLCIGLVVAGLLYVIVYGVRHNKSFKELCLTPGVLVYMILFMWIWLINRDRLFSSWDEFSHWGLVVKNMDFFNAFGNYKDSTVHFRGYPPAAALWEYFIGKLYGYFDEGHAYCAMGWLLTSMPVLVIKDLKWQNWCYAIFSVCALVYLPLIFTSIYIVSLYVDAMLGILTAYIFIFSFYYERFDTFYYITIAVAISILCLTKASGTFLAMIALLTIASAYYISSTNSKKERVMVLTKLLFCCGLGLLVGKYSWSIYLSLSGAVTPWDTNTITTWNLLNFMMGNGKEYQYKTLYNFYNALFSIGLTSGMLYMTYIRWVIVFFIISIIIFARSTILRTKLRIYLSGIWIGLIGYTIGLCLLYIFTYCEYEAIRLASFGRYLATYFIIIGLFLVSVFYISILHKWYKHLALLFSIICFIFFSIWNGVENLCCYQSLITKTHHQRDMYIDILRYIEDLNYSIDKIYIISQNDDGFDYWQLRYMITPIKTGLLVSSIDWSGGPLAIGWNLGAPSNKDDIWTVDCTVDEWLNTLVKGQCEYVYLHKIDDKFISRYGSAFLNDEIKPRTMYKLVFVGMERKLVQVT